MSGRFVVDQMSEPVVTPAATARPHHRPDDIDVPAIASVAGPGLALATSAASRTVRRLVSIIGAVEAHLAVAEGESSHRIQSLDSPIQRDLDNRTGIPGIAVSGIAVRIG